MSETIKKKISMKLILLLLAVLVVPGAVAQQLSAPIRQIKNEDAFRPGPRFFPTWNQGYLVVWEPDTRSSDTAENLAVYDREGNLVGKTRIWLQDASFLSIVDAAARKDGNVAVVGWAMTGSGTVAGFLGDVSVVRNSGLIIQTSPFEGQSVTFGPDGTIWVFGMVLGPGRGREPAPDHYMVQHFGTNDVLKDQHLLRSSFPCESHPAIRGFPRVLASGDRIGLFAPACRMWVELSLTGELLGQWKWNYQPPAPDDASKVRVWSVMLTPTNELYGRLEWSVGDGFFRFDRQASTWIPVDTSEAKSVRAPVVWLLGTDGDALVYATLDHKLAWATPDKAH
jgi:hypothetical protein